MNAQLNLQQHMDSKLLGSLLEMTPLDSFLKVGGALRGKNVVFTSDDKTLVPLGRWKNDIHSFSEVPINPIPASKEPSVVCGTDSSCVKIAETEDGTLYAIKCGVVFCLSKQVVLHFRIGPLLFYITENTLSGSDLDTRLVRVVSFDSDIAKRMIRINVERLIQFELSKLLRGSVILVDGALKASIFENRHYNLQKIIENCALYKNSLLGIGKSTKFKILDMVSGNLRATNYPAVLDVSFIVKSLVKNTFGYNTMVKFSKNSLVLRADVAAKNNGDVLSDLGKICGNDLLPSGYPECLSMAHHISCFSNTEIFGIRGHILNNYEVVELPSHDVRRHLLGSI